MAKTILAMVAVAALLRGTPEEGEAWLREAEQHLYAWPKPGVVVRFQVKTDVIENTIAALKKQLPPKPDPETVRAIEALRRIKISGSVDTETGRATADVQIPFETSDPTRKAGVERMQRGIVTMVTKSFEGLPFHDPKLLRKGGVVLAADAKGDAITVKVSGKDPGEEATIHLDRRRMLPESFESADMSMTVRYAEVFPGKFAPARLEVELPDDTRSVAAFTYQRVGDLVFPSTVQVELGSVKAKLEFQSAHVEPSGS